ncbi:MAG: metalloregulator ArsR/SmtB family transcription factor [candidate division KSB1 bacterium]|nr:metalloregulator ArsR/SmtB family transcription factor [candidate division KSB1 bacterium]
MNSPKTIQTDTIPETPEISTPDDYFATFKAISDHTRLRILNLLFHRELFVCEISGLIQHCDSTISAHLAILRDAGFIISERDGRWVKYRINPQPTNPFTKHMLRLLKQWLDHYHFYEQDIKATENINVRHTC